MNHQIIYTSCMRGINGINDGQQVFSYDASFTDANNDEIKSLFSYQPQILESGEIMTEERALLMPKSFSYRKLENGACALALNTYLGRDYMGSAGRFGNHLSHVITVDESDMNNYPCEFYGSEMLRDRMEFEEVNNPERPDFLPEPVIERGFVVDIDSVIEFLSIGDRIEIFKNMLCAVLAFETERKRVVICDEPENIIKWIAAIEYTLPLKTALKINFSTYDFDPSLSASQICGVIEKGSRYNQESQRLHFVFDFKQESYAEFEKDEHYFDFIDTSMSFSYDSLQDFHRFLTEGYNYDKADQNMYAAYRLYSLLSDGIEDLTESELKTALNFAASFAVEDEQFRIIYNLCAQKDSLMETKPGSFLCVMNYVVSKNKALSEDYKKIVRDIMVDRVLYEFLHNKSSENGFSSFYNQIDSVCRSNGFSVATELMKKGNAEKLFAVMQNDIASWKITFIVRVLCTYVKDSHLPVENLSIDAPLGQLYYGLVQAVYSQKSQNDSFIVSCIIDEFSSDCNYLVNKALNLEGMLLDLPNGMEEVDFLWRYFGQTMTKYQKNNFSTAYSLFASYQRFELMYMLYSLAMSNAADARESRSIFNEHYNSFVKIYIGYSQQFRERILTDYYNKLESLNGEDALKAKKDLFDIVSFAKIDIPFAENLVNGIVNDIPFDKLSSTNSSFIMEAYNYLYDTLHKPVKGRLQLLLIAYCVERAKNSEFVKNPYGILVRLIADGKADMSNMTEAVADRYFEWLLPNVCRICKEKVSMEKVYSLFNMPYNISELFFVDCTKAYLKQCKDEKDYDAFCEFLGFAAENGNERIQEKIGKVLHKLHKQKLSDLNKDVMKYYRKDNDILHYWNKVKDIAESTNPIFDNITNIFKRKK